MVLPDHSLRGGTQEEVQVNNTTNHPASKGGGGQAQGTKTDLMRIGWLRLQWADMRPYINTQVTRPGCLLPGHARCHMPHYFFHCRAYCCHSCGPAGRRPSSPALSAPSLLEGDRCLVQQHVHPIAVEEKHTMGGAVCTTGKEH